MTQKNYVFLQFEASVQPGNEGLVHHFIVYECHGDFNDTHFGAGYDCVSSANMPLRGCYINNMVAAWGIGGEVGNRTLLFFLPVFIYVIIIIIIIIIIILIIIINGAR